MPAGYLATHVQRPGPERQLPHRLRRQQPGRRRGDRDHPPRRGRRHALRRRPQHDPPVRRHGLQPADRPLEQQRRSRRRPRGRSTCNRDGFVLGEGAAMVVLEELRARQEARRARSTARSLGYGTTADAFRITDTHPEGRGAITCMKMALARRRQEPDRHRLHQRPRHQHAGERPGRDAGHQARRSASRPTRCPSPAPRA